MSDDKQNSSDPHPALPSEFLDSHHHFSDTGKNSFQSFLGRLAPNACYLPQDYHQDIVAPLSKLGVTVVGSVHIECLPDDGLEEAQWVESLTPSTVMAIVASCNLSSPTVDQDLANIKHGCPKVRGIRWVLDCVGKYDGGKTATHPATLRHDGIDYLRGSNGHVMPEFERGFSLLEHYSLSFDLQCAPVQLLEAAKLFARYPSIKVCIDHLGKPRTLLGPDIPENQITDLNRNELDVWRKGMEAMAALPNVYVKISMLGYVIPGWIRNDKRIALMRGLVLETVELFSPERCMVGTNWWNAANSSDSDGHSDIGPSPTQFISLLSEFFKDYSDHDRSRLFCQTAKDFYRI
jgi:predicted TIM-barrel fold metal-dependent hydrolase